MIAGISHSVCVESITVSPIKVPSVGTASLELDVVTSICS